MRFFGKKKEEPKGESAPVARTIYVCAKEVSDRIDEVAHPNELLQDDHFNKIVLEIAQGTYTDEELLTFAWSNNASLSALALAALSRRPATETLIAQVFENLNVVTAAAPRFFVLQALSRWHPAPEPLIGRVMVAMDDDWSDGYDRAAMQFAKELMRQRVRDGEPATFGNALERASVSRLDNVDALIRRLDDNIRRPLRKEFDEFRSTRTNFALASRF